MPDIFDEVDEELRAERARKLLQRYGGLLASAVVAVVVAVGGFQAWKWYDARQNAATAQAFLAAMKIADGPAGPGRQAAAPAFADIAARGNAGYRTLARLRLAALKADGGDLAGADALWEQVVNDSGADRLLRDVAGLNWVLHNLDQANPADVEARLKPLTAPDNAFRPLAEEAQALLALRQGKQDVARETLHRLAEDVTAPDGVRGRANGLLQRLGG